MKNKTGKDTDFKLTPVNRIPEQIMKQITRRRVSKSLYLSDGEYWDICHSMMRDGKLYRYSIKNVCDVSTPQKEVERFKPYPSRKTQLIGVILA